MPAVELRAGYARVCVTPPVGMAMEGLGLREAASAVHDDLYVGVLALQQSRGTVLVAGCDLLFFDRPHVDRLIGSMAEAASVAAEQVLLNCSHTHAGPRVSAWSYSPGPDEAYIARVEQALASAAVRALDGLEPVTVWAGRTRTDLPVCRRKPDASGRAAWKPYLKGTVCDELPVAVFRSAADPARAVCVVLSASCHPSAWYRPEISAEYPGVAVRLINQQFGAVCALFLQGAGGDSKPRPVACGEEEWLANRDWASVEAAGRLVADPASALIAEGLRSVAPGLGWGRVEARFAMESPPTPEQLRLAASGGGASGRPEQRLWAEDMLRRMRLGEPLPSDVPIRVHGVRIGDGLRLVGVEAELVADLGNQIRGAFGPGLTVPLGYTDGAQLYLPSDRQLPEGGYEVESFWEYHWPARLAPGIDIRLARACREVARAMEVS